MAVLYIPVLIMALEQWRMAWCVVKCKHLYPFCSFLARHTFRIGTYLSCKRFFSEKNV